MPATDINYCCRRTRLFLSLTIGLSTRWGMGEPMDAVEKTAEEEMYTNKLLNQKSSHNAIVSSIMATMFARSHETEEHAQRIASFLRIEKARPPKASCRS